MGKKSGGKSSGQATDVQGAPEPYSPLLKKNDAVLNSATKPPRGQGAKEFFSNPENISGIIKAGVGLGTGIADMVKKGKGEKGTNEGGGEGGGGGAPTPAGDEILGMSKPVFFGLIGGIVLIAGVGIFFAVRGGSSASAPAPATA